MLADLTTTLKLLDKKMDRAAHKDDDFAPPALKRIALEEPATDDCDKMPGR